MRDSSFNKSAIKCAFFNWIDMLMPNRRQYLALDMGETEEEWNETAEVFWRKFADALLDIEEVE